MSVNKAILIGRLGKDPEIRYSPNGEAIAGVSLATTEVWKDKQGQKQERTEWHNLTFFGRSAEVAGQYLKKGSQIYVEGRIRTEKYTDKQGVERYSTKIMVDSMQMLDSKSGGGNAQSNDSYQGGEASQGYAPPAERAAPANRPAPAARPAPPAKQNFDDFDDDIPF